jgi:hypothetical protein
MIGGYTRRRFFVVALGGALLFGPARAAAPLAPWFSLESTAGGMRTRASYAGQVVLLMYEDRDSTQLNATLKDEVRSRAQREHLGSQLAVVPVADVRRYDHWPARTIVRRAVVAEAKSLGLEILMDWSGAIFRAYGFRAPGSNVVLLGRDGTRLYQVAGALDAGERGRFHAILTRALASSGAGTDPSLSARGVFP